MVKKIFLVIFLLNTAPLISLSAETIILNSGMRFKAKVIESAKDFIKVDIIGVPVKYPRNEIKFVGNSKDIPPEFINVSKTQKGEIDSSKDSISIKIQGIPRKNETASRKRVGNYKRRR